MIETPVCSRSWLRSSSGRWSAWWRRPTGCARPLDSRAGRRAREYTLGRVRRFGFGRFDGHGTPLRDRDRDPRLLQGELEVVRARHRLHRVVDRDLALLDQLQERLVERHHAVVPALGDDFFDLRGLLFVGDPLGDAAGVDEDLEGWDPPPPHRWHEPLTDDPAERPRK